MADIRNIYQSDPTAAAAAIATYRRQRDYADRRLEFTGARADRAADLARVREAAAGAVNRIGERIDNDPRAAIPNRSGAALTQGDVLGSLAQIQMSIAIGRSRAVDAAARAADRLREEELRREIEARRLAGRAALEARWAQERAVLATAEAQRVESMYRGFRLHPVCSGN